MNYSIRRWKSTDIPVLVNYMNNVHIWSKLTDDTPIPFTEADAKKCIAPDDKLNSLVYAVEYDSNIIGGVKLTCGNAPNNIVYRMDFWLDSEFWDDDEVCHVLKDMVKFCFFHLPAMKIVVRTMGSDTTYHKVLEQAGFEKEAVLTRAILKSGNVEDLYYYTITE